MADYPVRVELLSRFRSPRERKRVVAGIAEGRGGHRDWHATGCCKTTLHSRDLGAGGD